MRSVARRSLTSEFAPVPEPAIRTGVKAMTSAMDVLKK